MRFLECFQIVGLIFLAGIDVSSGNNHNEEEGPYIYELFSIMIHSGSASGGHYYAYIKDFDRNMWFCFNDQSVSGVSYVDQYVSK